MLVTITIDGREVEVPEGIYLLEACKLAGIDIPHFCYHPGLGPDGNCRMCQVELVTERGARLVTSCNIPVERGMVVETDSERARKVRAAVEEFLLLNHPLDCPICDKAGECTLQDYYMRHDQQDSRMQFPKLRKRKAVSLGETLVLDQERCILCDRCVRFLRDIAGREELFIAGRGSRAYLTTFPGKGVTSPYSLNTVDLCPVGALTSKDFRFASPTWYLRKTPSVCTTCSRGCSVEIDHKGGRIYRLRPRYNAQVNGYWMCDEGRLNYKFVNQNRVRACEIRKEERTLEVTYEEAEGEILEVLGPGNGGGQAGAPAPRGERKPIVFLVSLTCTLEEMFAVKRFSSRAGGSALFAVRHVVDGEEDDLLRKRDRHPNARGAELLSLEVLDLRDKASGADMAVVQDFLSPGGVLFGVGFDYGISSKLEKVFSDADSVIAISACKSRLTEAARVVLPGLTFAEKEGLILNFNGHLQELRPANVGSAYVPEGFEGPGVGISQWKVISDLIAACTGGGGFSNVSSLREEIGREEPRFSGVDLKSAGEMGIKVSG